ncbi:hypothetical protein G6F57_019113 [Rhizopus arrhizus]|nr:hypothetical protein G6F57_019113 [Rhizopus arrhizus]
MRGGDHRAQVVCAVVAQRNLLHVRTVRGGDFTQRLESGVGHHQSRLRTGPQRGSTVQWFTGAGVQAHVVGGNVRLLDEGVADLARQREAIAAALGDAVARRQLCCRRGAVGAFVEIQQHGAVGRGRRRDSGGLCLAEAGQAAARQGEAGTGQLQERATDAR